MKSKRKTNKIDRAAIYSEFCQEMDLFSDSQPYPDWVFDFREDLLSKMSSSLIKICRKFKAANIEFKILYPMRIDGKWKFADIYINKCGTVVMVTTKPHPAAWLTDRARFFQDRCKVYELDGYESESSLQSLIDKLR